jgi:hypothetical protein
VGHTIQGNLLETVMPNMQHQTQIIKINGINYEQNIKPTKTECAKNLVS